MCQLVMFFRPFNYGLKLPDIAESFPQVLTHATTLLNAVDTFCTLDATLALALTGNELNFARPQITEENICVVV